MSIPQTTGLQRRIKPRSGIMRILVVEDHYPDLKLALRAIGIAFDPEAMDTYSAGNGREAIRLIEEKGNPDLILLDLMMPIMDGWECLEALRARAETKLIPVIAMTTSESQSNIDRFYSLGGNAYATKPLDPTKFQDTVSSIMVHWIRELHLPSRGD